LGVRLGVVCSMFAPVIAVGVGLGVVRLLFPPGIDVDVLVLGILRAKINGFAPGIILAAVCLVCLRGLRHESALRHGGEFENSPPLPYGTLHSTIY
jgi:hypothetical protein